MPKVSLRKFTDDDVLEYYSIAQDSNDYFLFGYCRNIKDAEDVIDTYINSDELESFAILNEKLELIGAIICITKSNILEISYFIGLEYRRKGYCFETLKLVEKLAKKRKMKKIEFFILKDNLKSINLAKKFGAKLKRNCKNYYILQKLKLKHLLLIFYFCLNV